MTSTTSMGKAYSSDLDYQDHQDQELQVEQVWTTKTTRTRS